MEMNYRLLNAESDTEIQQWLDLFRVCFYDTMDRDYWQWLIEKNPLYLKTKPLVLIAETGDRIIGSACVIPSQILVHAHKGHTLLNSGYIYGEMVHPDWRNQGIISMILKKTITLTKDEGYDLLTVFSTNIYSYKSLVEAGFMPVTRFKKYRGYLTIDGAFKNYFPFIPERIRKPMGFPLTGIFTRLFPRISHSYQVKYGDLGEYADEINKIQASNGFGSGIFGIRTPPYTRWRFSAPGIQSKCLSLWDGDMMLAYLILDYPDSGKNVLIEDLFAREDDGYLISLLMSEAAAILKTAKADSVWTCLTEENKLPFQIFSRRYGFISQSSLQTMPMSQFLCLPLKENLDPGILSDQKQWNLRSADFRFFEKCDY
jgi:GNAT superfamily N-acetyltransferase